MVQMPNRKTKLHKTEYVVFRSPPFPVESKPKILAAVSGGADSVAMLHILSRLQNRWGFHLEVAYVHHGKSNVKATARYRERAAMLVERLSDSLGHPFRSLTFSTRNQVSGDSGESEEAMREGRFRALEQFAENSGIELIALGHHADDLFETRLIRLMRGTGAQGLTSMKTTSVTASGKTLWRPLIQFRRAEIESYLSYLGLQKGKGWLADPSNANARYLRNAVRRKLIPLIEQLRPGGVTAMTRSLELIAEFVEDSALSLAPADQIGHLELNRQALMDLSASRRRESLSNWISKLGIRNFSKAHVDEMLKRIDTPQKRLSFELCGRVWFVGTTIRLAPGKS